MGWLNAFTVPSGAALKKLEMILTFCGSGGSCGAGLNNTIRYGQVHRQSNEERS
jgi:hypothetical protein